MVKKAYISDGMLTKYFPADYCDTFQARIYGRKEMTPDELLKLTFTRSVWWVDMLMKIRNAVVKPFGLKTGNFEEHLLDMIQCRSDNEIIIGMDDSHLSFYVSLFCMPKENDAQTLSLTTVVRYNNLFGRIYFFFISPFHRMIVKNSLDNVARS